MAAAVDVAPGRSGHSARRRVLRWGLFAALLAVEAVLVAPHLSFDTAAVRQISWPLIAVAAVVELVSLVAFAQMRGRLLRSAGSSVGRRRMGALTFASNAISVTAPAGTAVSAAYLFQQFRRNGVAATVAVWTLAAAGVVSSLAFAVLTVAGTMLDGDLDPAEIAGAAGASLLAGVALVCALSFLTSHPEPVLHGVERVARRLPERVVGRDGARVHTLVEQVISQLTAITPRSRDWAAALVLSVLNWALDLTCFVLCCYAVGVHGLSLGAAALAYVAGLATIGVSLTPGGLGSVEAGMLIGLAHGGVAAPLALAGVLAYRIIAFVFVGVLGWIAWLGVRRQWHASAESDDVSAGVETFDEPRPAVVVLDPAVPLVVPAVA